MELMWKKKKKKEKSWLYAIPFLCITKISLSLYVLPSFPLLILDGLLQSFLFRLIGRARELLPQAKKKKKILQHHKSVLNLYERKLDLHFLWINRGGLLRRLLRISTNLLSSL